MKFIPFKVRFAISAVAVCSTNCLAGTPIVGGTLVSANDAIAKSTVAIYLVDAKGEGALCTGSLLNNNTLVTAAHCVQGVQKAAVIFARNINKSQVGSLSANQVRQVTAATANPNFDLKRKLEVNDIAIVNFAGGIPSGYAPAELMGVASSNKAVQSGATVVIAGYGITSSTTEDSGVLRKTTMSVQSVSPNQAEVLLQSPGHSACHGDSGGPAFVVQDGHYYLWGVTSRGDSKCSMTIYTKIQAYLGNTQVRYATY